jgi:NTP pyrophosphatase (non-canonical NTP hydrolase)
MKKSLGITEYQTRARQTNQRKGIESSMGFYLLGLFGEVGSLLSEVKKKQRDPVAYLGYQDSVLEELGDVLWYLAAVADCAHLPLVELAVNLDRTVKTWESTAAKKMTFQEIEEPAGGLASSPSSAFERTLLQLAAEVGLLMTDHSAGRLDRNRSALEGRLIAILRALRQAAHEAGITLEAAAKANLGKIFDRWPTERKPPRLFDAGFPTSEQLPRKLVIEIEELVINGKNMARLKRDGKPIGDPLTDNREDDDDYRFHDVFHLSYAAHLGWSPTLRRLLKVKRKSVPLVDEVQDGARAVLIEEGIATWIFNYAQRLALFQGINSLDYGLLKSVRHFVSGYEAETCPLWLWEEAILKGYEIFRAVCEHRGGHVAIDLNARSIRYNKP